MSAKGCWLQLQACRKNVHAHFRSMWSPSVSTSLIFHVGHRHAPYSFAHFSPVRAAVTKALTTCPKAPPPFLSGIFFWRQTLNEPPPHTHTPPKHTLTLSHNSPCPASLQLSQTMSATLPQSPNTIIKSPYLKCHHLAFHLVIMGQ